VLAAAQACLKEIFEVGDGKECSHKDLSLFGDADLGPYARARLYFSPSSHAEIVE